MRIGVLKEVKPDEYRVALLPQGVRTLCSDGHTILVQSRAGVGAGAPDEDYLAAGAEIVVTPEQMTSNVEMVLKIKEPIEPEFPIFRDNQILFCYLHSETRPKLIDMLLKKRLTAIAFENVRLADDSLPLLTPMSIIAGQQGILQGMSFLCNHKGGRGVSLVAYPGLEPARVVVLGAGQAGFAAAKTAAALGAEVTLFELNVRRIFQISEILPKNIRLLHIASVPLDSYIMQADMVVHTTSIPPNNPSHLIDRKLLKKMKKGAVIVDVTANLRGAVETVDHYTTHADPVWEVEGIIHYAVTNIPGTVAATASQALAIETLPYIAEIGNKGVLQALQDNKALLQGLTAINGTLTWHEAGVMQKRAWFEPEKAVQHAVC
jgi:alanine dehydrogenase